jgi:hypothetical protein
MIAEGSRRLRVTLISEAAEAYWNVEPARMSRFPLRGSLEIRRYVV